MGDDEERRPEHRRSHGEMIFEVARAGAKFTFDLSIFIESAFAKAFICKLIVVCEIKTVLDERGAGISLITNPIPANPGIQKR